MVAWETIADERPFMRDYAEIWRAAEKVVFSKSLEQVTSARTRIEREFDPEAVGQMKASASRDISVGGPDLASQAIAAGLVDECHLFLAPVAVGTGNPALPIEAHLELELLDQRQLRQRHHPPPLPAQEGEGRGAEAPPAVIWAVDGPTRPLEASAPQPATAAS